VDSDYVSDYVHPDPAVCILDCNEPPVLPSELIESAQKNLEKQQDVSLIHTRFIPHSLDWTINMLGDKTPEG
jgi:hypothetical protein